jgi:hypothetical protein
LFCGTFIRSGDCSPVAGRNLYCDGLVGDFAYFGYRSLAYVGHKTEKTDHPKSNWVM